MSDRSSISSISSMSAMSARSSISSISSISSMSSMSSMSARSSISSRSAGSSRHHATSNSHDLRNVDWDYKPNLDCGSIILPNVKVFVIHYKKLIDRKTNILAQFKKNGITDFEFIEIDRDELHAQNTSMFEKDYSKSQIAIALSHFHAYEEIGEKYEHGLIFEDDAVLSPNFTNTMKYYITQLPNDYDMLFIGDGCNLHIEPSKLIPGKHIYKKSLHDGATRCTDSYLISKKCAKQLHHYIKRLSYKIKIPIDWWLNKAASDNNFKVYWVEPTIVTQGTQNGTYKTSHDESNNQSNTKKMKQPFISFCRK